jgi:hypothetical protein
MAERLKICINFYCWNQINYKRAGDIHSGANKIKEMSKSTLKTIL